MAIDNAYDAVNQQYRCYDPRIIAIDLRHRRFGYAVYEGHRTLLDWGVRVYRATGAQEAILFERRFGSLLQLFSPATVVIKLERWKITQANQETRRLVESLEVIARARSVQIKFVAEADIYRDVFGDEWVLGIDRYWDHRSEIWSPVGSGGEDRLRKTGQNKEKEV